MDLSTKISGPPADDYEVSDEPMPFDANTPSSSPSQPNNYLWSDEKLQILNEHKVYHDSMSYYLTNLYTSNLDQTIDISTKCQLPRQSQNYKV